MVAAAAAWWAKPLLSSSSSKKKMKYRTRDAADSSVNDNKTEEKKCVCLLLTEKRGENLLPQVSFTHKVLFISLGPLPLILHSRTHPHTHTHTRPCHFNILCAISFFSLKPEYNTVEGGVREHMKKKNSNGVELYMEAGPHSHNSIVSLCRTHTHTNR